MSFRLGALATTLLAVAVFADSEGGPTLLIMMPIFAATMLLFFAGYTGEIAWKEGPAFLTMATVLVTIFAVLGNAMAEWRSIQSVRVPLQEAAMFAACGWTLGFIGHRYRERADEARVAYAARRYIIPS